LRRVPTIKSESPVAGGATALGPVARLQAVVLRFPTLSAFVLFLTLGALTKAAFWGRTPGFDAGQYLYVGGVILDGEPPYLDAANNKGPVLFLVFALIRLVAGTSTAPVWIAALVFAVLAALALAGYVSSYAGRWGGFLAGLIFAAIGAAPLRATSRWAASSSESRRWSARCGWRRVAGVRRRREPEG